MSDQSTNPETKNSSTRESTRIRWWPAVLILLVYGGIWLTTWVILDDVDTARGLQIVVTQIATGVAVLSLLVWELFFARLGFRSARWWRVQGVIALVVIVLISLFRIDYADGDASFSLTWRWVEDAYVNLDANVQLAPDSEPVVPNPVLDYPGFLGENRDGIVPNVSLAADWDANPPRELWRIEQGAENSLGAAHSSFAIVGERAYTQELRGDAEYVSCFELLTGELIWRNAQTDDDDAVVFESNVAGDGPRATPTYYDGRIYAVGSAGLLACFDATTGERLWEADIFEHTESINANWGYSASPLIAEPHVIVSAGGSGNAQLVGYRLDTTDSHPQPAVRGGDAELGGTDFYVSPTLRTICGVPQVLHINNKGIAAFDPESLDLLWEHPWPWQGGFAHPLVSQPVVLPDNHVFVSAGYTSGDALIQVSRDDDGRFSSGLIWLSNNLKSKFTNVLVQGDYLYGLDARILTCVEWRTGKRQWKVRAGTYGHGQVILVGDKIPTQKIIVQAETGELALVRATPESFEELGRIQPFEDRTWNNPAISGKYLLLRNHLEAACYELPLMEE